MEIDRAAETQRLKEHYRQMYDAELLNLAADTADLTEIAQQVLCDELKLRGLVDQGRPGVLRDSAAPLKSEPLLPPSQWETSANLPVADVDGGDESPAHAFTWKTLLCECNEREQAWQIREVLQRAGIESWIETPTSYAISLGGSRVVVAADQLDHAREIASQPIPQDIVDESKMKIPEYELPSCPRCGAVDPVLESVDPVNTWACESCGAGWSDPEERQDS
jgi:hypothetical protein